MNLDKSTKITFAVKIVEELSTFGSSVLTEEFTFERIVEPNLDFEPFIPDWSKQEESIEKQEVPVINSDIGLQEPIAEKEIAVKEEVDDLFSWKPPVPESLLTREIPGSQPL